MRLTRRLLPGKLRDIWEHQSGAPAREDIAEQFTHTWQAEQSNGPDELLPVRLAAACVSVLPASGAGISLFYDDFRVPLGASDDAASCAERLQFTTGEGPCLDAIRTGNTVLAGREEILDHWPEYGQELVTRTPYDAVISLPVTITGQAPGALDLFFTDQPMLGRISLADVTTVRSQITEAFRLTEAMADHVRPLGGGAEPAWLHGPTARKRTHVWIAMGMVMTRFELVAADALALLRAYAYGTGSTVDQLADELINGRQELAPLRP